MNPFGKLHISKKENVSSSSKIITLIILVISLNQKCAAFGKTLQTSKSGTTFQVIEVARGLGVPWGMVFISRTKILFTERKGLIGILEPTSGEIKRIEGGPKVFASGQGGLLDVAVPYGYDKEDWIYFTYSKEVDTRPKKYATTLAKAKLDGYRLIKFRDLLITKPASSSSVHFGSRITFDKNGNLYFSVGDRGNRQSAQNLTTHSGSILRLRLDGSVPKDNPFLLLEGALNEIWSYGHRNPQGIFYDRELNQLWSIEHGPRGGDEINLILPGLNYGWPVISYGKEYWGPIQVGEGTKKEGMEQPIKFYVPSIAPGSLIKYSGKAFSAWKGNLFAGALKLTHLNRIELNNTGKAVSEERLLDDLSERIRAIVESPEGWIYISTDSGKILSLRPVKNNQ